MKKKLSFKTILVMLAMVMGLSATGFTTRAADYAGPAISMFYPGFRETPMELKPNAKAYIYFATGSKITSVKAQVVQNDQVLGTCVYAGAVNPGTTATMDPSKAENAVMPTIPAGLFTIKVFEVNYLVNGEAFTYSDVDNPIGEITYERKGSNGTIVAETGFSGRTIKSYYAPDDNDGLKTYTFSKAVVPENITVDYSYGMGENYSTVDLPFTVSADGKTLSIDVRGVCYNPDVLAPGVTFKDDSGNPTDPPSIIILEVNHLVCTDGTQIESVATPLEGGSSHTLTGRINVVHHYLDVTHATPVLTGVEFFASSKPAERFTNINASTDMMALAVDNADVIESASILLSAGDVKATVPMDDITVDAGVFTATLPAAIRAEGSDNLVISLVDVVYTTEDGVNHVIAPLDLSSIAKERTTIAQIRSCEPGTDAILLTEGVKVTLSNDSGYTFIEDATGALMVLNAENVFTEGTLVTGRIAGKYTGNGSFRLDEAASDFSAEATDVSQGILVNDIAALSDGSYDFRLVTIAASSTISMGYDATETAIVVSSQGNADIFGIVDYIDGFTVPAEVTNITGVFFPDSSGDMVILRGMDDINRSITASAASIAELKTLAPGSEVKLVLDHAKVIYHNEDYGISIVDDGTGGIMITDENDEAPLEMGTAVTGTIHGVYGGSHQLIADSGLCEYDLSVADITAGETVDASTVTTDSHAFRLLTFNHSDEQPITADGMSIYVGSNIIVVDLFGVIPDDYVIPDDITSITGIVYPMMGTDTALNAAAEGPVYMVLRSIDDILTDLSGIETIAPDNADGTPAVYDLRGVKMNEGSLAPGIYIVGDKKILVK